MSSERLCDINFKSISGVCHVLLATFRLEYDYDIEYEYDFSNLVRVFQVMSHTNFVPRAVSTDQQQGEAKVLGT